MTLPLILAEVDKFIPTCKLFSNPAILLPLLIVKAALVHMAKGTPLVSKNITGRDTPLISFMAADLALVEANPSTDSGPISLHSVPV